VTKGENYSESPCSLVIECFKIRLFTRFNMQRKGRGMRRLETLDFWPELIELKDSLSLRQLAAKFSVTPGAVSAALKRSGISRTPAPSGPRGGRRREDPAVTRSSKEGLVARHRPGSKDSAITAHLDLLGKIADWEIADRAGVSIRTVASFRARHSIPGFTGSRKKTGRKTTRRSKIDPFVSLLGQVPDRVVAERAGVSLNAVRNYRVKRGIPASGRRGARKFSRTPTGKGDFNGSKHAWRVTAGRGGTLIEGVIIAEDLQGASHEASVQLQDAVVTRVEWLGPLLG
jgi:hypothetical protein